MEPYTLYISGIADSRDPAIRKFPPEQGILLSYAHSIPIGNKSMATLRQTFLGQGLFLEHCTCFVKKKTTTIYAVVNEAMVVFSYLIKGSATLIWSPGSASPVVLHKNQYAGIYLCPGTYRINMKGGSHLALSFAINEQLLCLITESLPILNGLINQALQRHTPSHFPVCGIHHTEKQAIEEIQHPRIQKGFVESALIGPITKLLTLYELRLQSGHFLQYKTTHEKIYDVKEYIQNNYTRPGCQVKQLARKFSSTGRTLSREYKKEFGITIQEHIIKLRMALATKLLEQNCLIKEVTTAVGYQNPFSFSRMFKKYYGYPPTKKKPRRKFTCFV